MTQEELMEGIKAAIPDHGVIIIGRSLRTDIGNIWNATVYARAGETSLDFIIAKCVQAYTPEDTLVAVCRSYGELGSKVNEEIEKLERQLKILKGE